MDSTLVSLVSNGLDEDGIAFDGMGRAGSVDGTRGDISGMGAGNGLVLGE
jgi:hypothetical protein